jgi:catechol 2,3-dioxygenase-like lactoylglutathione lyase family enzyme
MASTNTKAAITPVKLAHAVLRTNKINQLRDFYLDFLGATLAFEEPNVMVLIRYDDEHHRIGIIGIPDIADKVKSSSGLEVHRESPIPAHWSANEVLSIWPSLTPPWKSSLWHIRRGKSGT